MALATDLQLNGRLHHVLSAAFPLPHKCKAIQKPQLPTHLCFDELELSGQKEAGSVSWPHILPLSLFLSSVDLFRPHEEYVNSSSPKPVINS